MAQSSSEDASGCDSVLYRHIDTDAAGRRHCMGSITDAEQSGTMPPAQMVDLDGEEFHLVPIAQLLNAISEKWRDSQDGLAEICQPLVF
jgi:hypothetical protein